MKKPLKLPHFKNEDEERAFWATHDSTDYVDWRKAKKIWLRGLLKGMKPGQIREKRDRF